MSDTTNGDDRKPVDPPDHRRPEGASDDTVAAAGKVSEALECIERARGRLYDFHQLLGHADLMLDEAVELLERSGHTEEAEHLSRELIGRNVIEGRWTFQIVEDFDDNYWQVFRDEEKRIRDRLTGGTRHVFEAEMKEKRRTHGLDAHRARP